MYVGMVLGKGETSLCTLQTRAVFQWFGAVAYVCVHVLRVCVHVYMCAWGSACGFYSSAKVGSHTFVFFVSSLCQCCLWRSCVRLTVWVIFRTSQVHPRAYGHGENLLGP